MNKQSLRQSLLTKRNALSQTAQATASFQITQRLIQQPFWKSVQHVALYWAVKREIDLSALLQLTPDKKFYLPVITGDILNFHRYRLDTPLAPNRYGIPEPQSEIILLEDLEIICLPLVGFNAQGHRLGMGGGFYDRTLSQMNKPYLIGIAYSWQQCESLPIEAHDQTMDAMITESNFITVNPYG